MNSVRTKVYLPPEFMFHVISGIEVHVPLVKFFAL